MEYIINNLETGNTRLVTKEEVKVLFNGKIMIATVWADITGIKGLLFIDENGPHPFGFLIGKKYPLGEEDINSFEKNFCSGIAFMKKNGEIWKEVKKRHSGIECEINIYGE